MRLFVAIDIDETTRAQLNSTCAAMQAVLESSRWPPRVTWVKPENAHVTIRFIGEVDEARVGQVGSALLRGVNVAPFDVCWDQVGAFPNLRRPNVLWIGPRDKGPLVGLAASIGERIDAIVGPGEDRTFRPHLTLGRIRQPGKGVDWNKVLTAPVWRATTTHVDHVTLYVSTLSPKGPTYTALCKVPL